MANAFTCICIGVNGCPEDDHDGVLFPETGTFVRTVGHSFCGHTSGVRGGDRVNKDETDGNSSRLTHWAEPVAGASPRRAPQAHDL